MNDDEDRFEEEMDSLISEVSAECSAKAPAVTANKDDTSPLRKTYLCPVSACLYTCPTMSPHIAALHLQSSHASSHLAILRFLVL